LVATAAQSLLDKKDKAKWGANVHVKQVGVDLPFARMKRVERLGVQGKLDAVTQSAASDASDDGEDVKMNGPEDDTDTEEGRTKKGEKEKKKLRGRNKSLKRYLRKQRKNVVDPQVLAVRAKVERMREEAKVRKMQAARQGQAGGEGKGENKRKSALDRFRTGAGAERR
jgi:U3 small nucleolar RNA-associated protein 7